MYKIFTVFSLVCCYLITTGQEKTITDTSWKKTARLTPTRINNLVHTKLDVRFNYETSQLYGKAWINLTPHLYPTDSLELDAKGMDIKSVALSQSGKSIKNLSFVNTGEKLKIRLDKSYKKGDVYTVYIDYTANPDAYEKASGRDPMLGAKGLYFINPKGVNKKKPIQIWTQGETESNSVWFPTIDQTQQKCTQELTMTVPAKYVTLSNGKLISQKNNPDGTRTDYWKMDLPHSPYLFFMGVGDYAVIKDSWKGKEVNYYVEPEYASVAKKIFGNTPEMMTFFSSLTGVPYPWVKYSQMTARDYVAGAMENTTATLHQNSAQQDARELTDGNIWEGTIAHELFHQWFGDYVTAESWSNLTVNESFANYSQLLWEEYKYGKDAALAEHYKNMQEYMMGDNNKKDLVRFYYADREDMFDAVSYQKGGRILHMLRNYIGDSAFFKGLNLYLTQNKFKSAEAHHLRLALEEISGMDLTWFFNQWYYGSGHPQLDIKYAYDENSKQAIVTVKQTQSSGKIFTIPTFIDIYNGKERKRHQIWIKNAVDSFRFDVSSKPDLINFDGDKILLAEKKENKNLENYIHQFYFAGNYLDRKEAVDFCGRKTDDPKALALLKDALKDPYHGIRELALGKINMKNNRIKNEFEPLIATLVNTEKNRPVKASMISALGKTENNTYKSLYISNITDSSYSVAGAALEALSKIDSTAALEWAKKLSNETAKGRLDASINSILVASGNEEVFDRLAVKFNELELSNEKFMLMQQLGEMLGKMKSNERLKQGISIIATFRDEIPSSIKNQTDPYINGMIFGQLLVKLKMSGNQEMVKFLEEKLK